MVSSSLCVDSRPPAPCPSLGAGMIFTSPVRDLKSPGIGQDAWPSRPRLPWGRQLRVEARRRPVAASRPPRWDGRWHVSVSLSARGSAFAFGLVQGALVTS